MWATASLIKSVGCDNVHLTCSSTDLSYVMQSYTDGGVDLSPAKECLKKKCGSASQSQTKSVVKTVLQLHSQYPLIFRTGNRNAASHLWFSFINDRSLDVSRTEFLTLASGYCAVSGSPVSPNPKQLFSMSLPFVQGGNQINGFMYFCCWPCGCDTKAHIKLDTKSITTNDGSHSYYVAVIGDPCKNPAFSAPPEAPELKCEAGKLKGATFSDHGHVILGLFFMAKEKYGVAASTAVVTPSATQLVIQNKHDVDGPHMTQICKQRADGGHQSGMGAIFINVAKMTPVSVAAAQDTKSIQTFTMSDISISSYNADTKLKTAVEKGFGNVLGLVICSSNECVYKKGCSVTSKATAARRSGVKIHLTAVANGTPVLSVGASTLAAGIAAVVSKDSRLKGVSAPSASSIARVGSLGGVMVADNTKTGGATSLSASEGDDSDGGTDSGVVVAIVVSVVAVAVIVAGAVFIVRKRRRGEEVTSEQADSQRQNKWEQVDESPAAVKAAIMC